MQKQKKQMILILVLLLIFGAAYGGMRVYNKKQAEKESAVEEAAKVYVTEVKQENITAFSYQNGEETLEFVKEEDTWVSKNDESIKLDQAAVDTMLEKIASLEAEEIVESPEELSEYGFDAPTNILTYTTEEGTTTLTIGMENSITNQYYLTKDGEDTLYLIGSSFPSAFQQGIEDLEDTSEASTEEIIEEISEESSEEAVEETEK